MIHRILYVQGNGNMVKFSDIGDIVYNVSYINESEIVKVDPRNHNLAMRLYCTISKKHQLVISTEPVTDDEITKYLEAIDHEPRRSHVD